MTQIFLSYYLFETKFEVNFVVFARLRLRALKDRTAKHPGRAARAVQRVHECKRLVGPGKGSGRRSREGIWSDLVSWSDDYFVILGRYFVRPSFAYSKRIGQAL